MFDSSIKYEDILFDPVVTYKVINRNMCFVRSTIISTTKVVIDCQWKPKTLSS